MKKSVKILFLFALLLSVAGAFFVSCQKDDPAGRREGSMPEIIPSADPMGDRYVIKTDGTRISYESSGYSFEVRASAVTFFYFTCTLSGHMYFTFTNECNLTLNGDSTFVLELGGRFGGQHLTLSGDGSITIMRSYINEFDYNDKFSAAEGYTLTYSGKKDAGNGMESCTWRIAKSE